MCSLSTALVTVSVCGDGETMQSVNRGACNTHGLHSASMRLAGVDVRRRAGRISRSIRGESSVDSFTCKTGGGPRFSLPFSNQ